MTLQAKALYINKFQFQVYAKNKFVLANIIYTMVAIFG